MKSKTVIKSRIKSLERTRESSPEGSPCWHSKGGMIGALKWVLRTGD